MTKRGCDSPALRLLQLVWDEQGHQLGHSWERLNSAMWQALVFAAACGLRFDLTDFAAIGKRFRPERWALTTIERVYAIACGSERGRGNPSAALAFEHWRNRKPFLLADEGVTTSTRIYVGREIVWRGCRLTVTSFADDGESFMGCEYEPDSRKPKCRVRVRRGELAAYRKATKPAGGGDSRSQSQGDRLCYASSSRRRTAQPMRQRT